MRCLLSLYLCLAVWISTAATAIAAVDGSLTPSARDTVPEELFSALDELARIVDVAYCVGTTGVRKPFQCLGRCEEFKGFELVKTWHTGPLLTDSCGYLALSHPPWPKRIILAFRGTYSLTNAVVDLAASPQPYTPYNNTNEGGDQCTNCTVHTGFLLSWLNGREEVLPELSQIRTEYSDYSLVLVGHSLGGAVAALAGLEFAVRGWEPRVTTFGEPRIGNAAFATYLNEQFRLEGGNRNALGEGRVLSLYHRVTHVNDPVPLLPFEEWGYAPHAGEIYISKVDVPPEVTDVSFCHGNADPECSTGQDAEEQARSVVAAMEAYLDSAHEYHPYQVQAQIPISALAFPSRLKLWELFFAHRDYFSRLGVCLPQFGEERRNRKGNHDHSRVPGWKWWEKLKKKLRPWIVEG